MKPALTYSEAKVIAQSDADNNHIEMVVIGDRIGRRNGFSITTAAEAKKEGIHVWSRHKPQTETSISDRADG